jgi:hypothetical protein
VIRADRWQSGSQFGGGEVAREVRVDAVGTPYLALRLRQGGQTTDNVGARFGSHNHLQFTAPEKISRLEVRAKIVKGKLSSHCPLNGSTTSEVTGLEFLWPAFNDGSSTGPFDRTGNVQPNMRAVRRADTLDPPGVFRLEGGVCRCPDASCNITGAPGQCTGFGGGQLPAVQVGVPFTVRLVHETVAKTFVASVVAPGNPTAVMPYPTSVPASPSILPAVLPFGYVQVFGVAANCTVASGGPKEFDVETQVFAVRTNVEAVVP